jgi:serine/threonine protein kinase
VLVLHKGSNWWVKIADFGISKRVDGTFLRTIIGTEAYLAPEVRGFCPADSKEGDESIFSFAVDIWAVGAITFRMVTGRLAFPPGRMLLDYVDGRSPFPIEESTSPEYAKFVMETMAASPRQRPTSQRALSYKWIQMEEILMPSLDTKPIPRYITSLR